MEPDFLGSDGRCRLEFARQDKRAITLASKGVLVSGRYGHGKPAKPVNTEILYAAPVEPCRGNGRHVQGDGMTEEILHHHGSECMVCNTQAGVKFSFKLYNSYFAACIPAWIEILYVRAELQAATTIYGQIIVLV